MPYTAAMSRIYRNIVDSLLAREGLLQFKDYFDMEAITTALSKEDSPITKTEEIVMDIIELYDLRNKKELFECEIIVRKVLIARGVLHDPIFSIPGLAHFIMGKEDKYEIVDNFVVESMKKYNIKHDEDSAFNESIKDFINTNGV